MKTSIIPRGTGFQLRYWHPIEKRYIRTQHGSKKDAEKAEKDLSKLHKVGGGDAILSPEELRDYRSARALLPEGATLLSVVQHWLTTKPLGIVETTINAAKEEYLAGLESKVSKGHFDEVARILGRWSGWFGGDKPLTSVTPQSIRDYLAMRRADGAAHNTVGSDRRKLFAFFEWSRTLREYVVSNPVQKTEAINVSVSTPEFYTVAEAKKILRAAWTHDKETLWLVVLSLFGLMRADEASRLLELHPDQIRTKEKTIFLSPDIVKSEKDDLTRGRLLQELPDVLWDWVEFLEKHSVAKDHAVANLHQRRSFVFQQSGVERGWVHSGLRKTGITHYIQAFDDAKVIKWCGHTSGKTTYKHYVGIASKTDGEAYLQLKPEVVLSDLLKKAQG